MFPIQEVTDNEIVFAAYVSHLMPEYAAIPDEFKRHTNKWNRIFAHWFYKGIRGAEFTPKPGVDADCARRHLGAIIHSYEPKHEHKEAAVAYLLSQWFEDVRLPEGEVN